MGSARVDLQADDPLVDGRLVPSRLGELGHALTTDLTSPEHREVELETLIDDKLTQLVEAHGRRLGVDDRVAASLWTNHLVTAACPPVLATWTLHAVGLDASPSNLALHLEDELPRQVRVLDPTRTARGDPDRDLGPRTLLETTTRLFEALAEATGIETEILDNHVGNLAAYLFDRLAEAGYESDRLQADRETLLASASLPWNPASNPWRDPVDYQPLHGEGLPERYQVRRRCCLKLAVDGKPPCASCPSIGPERRTALVRDRRAKR